MRIGTGVGFVEDVWRYIEKYGLLEERHAVGAAVSGGPDSMALLICLCELSREHDFSVTALHFDHGTRGGQSSEDAEFVRGCCERAGIPLVSGSADVPALAKEWGVGLELAGRRARGAFFSDAVKDGLVDAVATAHHMDDNAESILLHLIRGCGLDGLRGIRRDRGHLIRPFLGIGRSDIERFVSEREIPFVSDASNEDTAFDRNFLRRVVLPQIRGRLNPSVSKAVCRLAQAAESDADCLDEIAEDAYLKCATKTAHGIEIECSALRGMHAAIKARVIRRALGEMGRETDIERRHVEKLLDLAEAATGQAVELGGGLRGRSAYGLLVLEEIEPGEAQPFSEKLVLPGTTKLPNGAVIQSEYVQEREQDTKGSFCEYADAGRIPEGAVVRTRRPGDRLRPLGGPGRRKLKEFFIDRKIPRRERDSVPLLAHGQDILWVIGGVLSENLRVTETTKRICRLSYVLPAGASGRTGDCGICRQGP